MDRFQELNQKRETIGLNATESREFEVLFNSHSAASRSPEVQQARAETLRTLEELRRTEHQVLLTHIFRMPITRNGERMTVDATQSNANQILGWLHPNEQLTVELFQKIIQEQPRLADQLSWSKVLSMKERQKQAQEHAQVLRSRFAQVCRMHQIAETQANFELWSGVNNPVLTELHGKPCILNEDGEILELTPASEAEKKEWEQERFEANQQKLREMAAAGDIAGLRAASAAERAERSQNIAQLNRDYSLLRGFATRQEYLLPPLPATWNGRPLDATRIKQGGRELFSQIGKRHGFERINAVLYGLDESFFTNFSQKLKEIEYKLYGVVRTAH